MRTHAQGEKLANRHLCRHDRVELRRRANLFQHGEFLCRSAQHDHRIRKPLVNAPEEFRPGWDRPELVVGIGTAPALATTPHAASITGLHQYPRASDPLMALQPLIALAQL